MDVNVVMRELTRRGFNNESHLDNFLSDLYRTDKEQKGANKNTEFCIASFYIDGELKAIPFGNLSKRKELRNVSKELIEAYELDATDLVVGILHPLFINNNDEDIKDQLEYNNIVEIIDDVIMRREDLEQCLFHITHLDREEYHIYSFMVI